MRTFLDTASLAEMLVLLAGLSFFGCVLLLALVSWAGTHLRKAERDTVADGFSPSEGRHW